MDDNKKKLIVVTGFGPFAGHEEVNASWEAVKLLPEHHKEYQVKKYLVPVVYEEVDKIIEDIWKQKPYLVIHVGVHGRAKCMYVEKLAYNHEFKKMDYSRRVLECPTICLQNNDEKCCKIKTKLDVRRIVSLLNDMKGCGCSPDMPQFCSTSSDVGNYLCGYIYLKSLDRDPERSLFLHVPPVDKPFSSEETSEAIFEIVKECVSQLEDATEKIQIDNKI